jgi:hypothetical protein
MTAKKPNAKITLSIQLMHLALEERQRSNVVKCRPNYLYWKAELEKTMGQLRRWA